MEGRYRPARRRLLRMVAGGITGAVLARKSAAARARDASSPQTSAPRLAVSSRTIKIGMSAAFTGTAAALGTELYRGAQAYYDEVNDRGGIHGRPVSVSVLDGHPGHVRDDAGLRRRRVSALPIERFFRDARAGSVMAPTVDVLHDFMGKALAGIPLCREASSDAQELCSARSPTTRTSSPSGRACASIPRRRASDGRGALP